MFLKTDFMSQGAPGAIRNFHTHYIWAFRMKQMITLLSCSIFNTLFTKLKKKKHHHHVRNLYSRNVIVT